MPGLRGNCRSRWLKRLYPHVTQVVGIYDEACEVLFDAEFPGGTDLAGRQESNLVSPNDPLENL